MTGGTRRADAILVNGRITTMDPRMPDAQALAIRDDRIFAVGTNSEILDLASADTKRIDLEGKRVTPGINDAHSHPIRSGVAHLRQVACDVNSIAEVKQRIADRVAKVAPGEWVLGFLYDDGKTERPVNRYDLDDVAPENPVFIKHRGGHTAFVNSLALKLAGINDDTPNPVHGEFFREDGKLNGRVAEAGQAPFNALTAYEPTANDYCEGAAFISTMMASKGITSVCDASGGSMAMRGALAALAQGRFHTRLYTHFYVREIEQAIAAGLRSGFGNPWVKVGALKMAVDGSISERTAWLAEPYIGLDDFHGIPTMEEDECYRYARMAHDAGWQLGIHANGELAIDMVLRVFERVQREAPHKDPRFRIEHCTVLTPELIARIKAIGAIPVLFAGYVYFHGPVMPFYGKKRLERMFALRSLIDAGIVAAASSDYTASPPDPAMWFRSSVTRTDYEGHVWGPSQRVSLQEALASATTAGAYASFEETEKGRIAPGMFADLVVWEQDLFATPPEALVNVRPQRTMAGGQWIYEA
ncbi:hypothetical protein B2G71_08535 [Novosphingobium sp. PC22D]|nr:hypothetical protein B2G71_08535 [Novosphingobium sp. PC22D]